MNKKFYMLIIGIAALMRVALLWSAPLWYDENFTLLLARLPFMDMIRATAGDVHPPLWYLIEWILFHVWRSAPAWAIRLPSLVFSLASLYLFIRITNNLIIPPNVQTIAVVMMAILPMQIWYAQEGRMYALLEFLVLLTLYLSLRSNYDLIWLSMTAMLYTQNYGLFYLAAIWFVIVVIDRKQMINMTISAAFACAFFSPWIYVVTQQMTEISGRYWIMDISAGAVLKTIYQQFWASAMLGPGVIGSYIVTFIALIMGFASIMREKHPAWFIVVMMAILPMIVAYIVSLIWQPLLLFRPLIGISPFLYLIVAWNVERLPALNLRPVLYVACFIVPITMLGIGGYYSNISAMKGDGAVSPMLTALAYVERNWKPGDVIYYTDDGPMINIMPYTDLPQYRMPGCDEEKVSYAPVLGSLSVSTRKALGANIAALDEIPHRRAWVFAPRSPLHPKCYDEQIAALAPEGQQLITVDENEYLSSGVWLVEK